MLPALALSLSLAALPDLHVRPPALHLELGGGIGERETQAAMLTALAGLLILEAAIVYQRDHGHVTPTISQVLQEWGTKFGTPDLVAGELTGHWFWPVDVAPEPRVGRRNAMVLLWLTAGSLAWDLLDHSGHDRSRGPVLFAVGFVSGHLFAPQGR